MKTTTLPIPELGAIAATRGMLGAGIALLLADRIPADRRKKIGCVLAGIGVVTTLPLVMDIVRRSRTRT